MDALWSIRNLHVEKNGKVMVDVPELDIPVVKMVALIGPNGAGKSSLVKALMGFHGNGDIRLEGEDAAKVVARAGVGYLGQHERFELPLTLIEYALLGRNPNMGLFSRISKEDETLAMGLLESFDMAHLAKKRITSLSGGEKQRAAIARVLIQKTRHVVMDEPTNHLDIRHQHLLMKKLQEAESARIVMVLHDLNLAANYSDYVILMKDGKVMAKGRPLEVMHEENLAKAYDWSIRLKKEKDYAYFVSLGADTQKQIAKDGQDEMA